MSHPHLSRHLLLAATSALALGAAVTPALAATGSQVPPKRTLRSEIKQAESTPLGAAIVHQDNRIRLDVPLQGSEIGKFAANATACEKAEVVVRAVAPRPGSDQAEIKREWLKGVRYLAAGDRLDVTYLHAHPSGTTFDHLKMTALNDSDYGDGLTGWAFNALVGDPGPLPRR